MLAGGKFPRLAAIVAILAPILLIVDLEYVGRTARSLLISNSIDFVVVLVAALLSLYVGRRTRGFARQLWILLGIALALEAIGQGLSSYYQSFDRGSLNEPVPSDIFFFVWAAPVFMIFVPRSDENYAEFDWPRILDFLQVMIVALTMYLYFFYTPSRWATGQFSLIRELLILYIVRDLLLTVGFLTRARGGVPGWFRKFCMVLAVVFVAAAFSDSFYLFTFNPAVEAPSWGDVLWVVPYVMVIFLALSWKEPQRESVQLPRTRVGSFLAQEFLPIGLPLLVIFMAQTIARERFVLSWLAVIVSVACSSARLILSNRKARRITEDLLYTEQALRRSERMLSTAFRSSPDAFSISVFPDGKYLEVNDGFTRLTGYTREEILQKNPTEANLWTDPEERGRVLAEIKKTGDVRDIEFHFRTKTGQIRVGLMSGSLLEIDGRTCALVVVRDITARKEAENILRTNEERFRSLVQNLHVGIVIYDPEARILFANPAALDLVGTPLEQVIGKSTTELGFTALCEDGRTVPESERPVMKVLTTRQPVRNLMVGWHRPGAEDFWTLLDAVPEFSSTGELVRVVVSLTDLTAQKRAAEALRESEERFRTLVRDLHVGVSLTTPDLRVEFANAAAHRMFDIPEGSAIGKLPAELGFTLFAEDGTALGPEDHPTPVVLRTGKAVPNGLLAMQRTGSDKLVWLFGNAVPQFDANGKIIRVILSFADVTEMKDAERAIHQLSSRLLRLQDEERRRIGRELHDGLAQTVLAINLSLAQVRQSLKAEEHPAARALEKARSLTQQMSREIRTLSYLLHPPLLDDLGLVSAVREYAQGFSERSAIDTELQVLSEFGRLPQPVELALFRIVQESLANIQRHSGSKTATIRLQQDGSEVTLEVIDFGHGMNSRGNGARKDGEARLGVGIAGMRERMAQLGGHLELVSGPGGTTVRATISVAPTAVGADLTDSVSRAL